MAPQVSGRGSSASTSPVTTKIGHGLAKVLGIKLHYRNELGLREEKISRGESVFSVSSADEYIEEEPSSLEWIKEQIPDARGVAHYFYRMVPFIHWLPHYNVQWLIGDLVAGITIGAVVVPQSMAYAKLANLPVEFGLYSAFMGVIIYWFFATSKDITIGPVAVMSTVVGNIVAKAADELPQYQGYQIASCLAVILGCIVTALGLLRLGRIVDFISLTSVTAFITGSSIFIAVGQVPGLLGIPSTIVNSRTSTYLVVIHTLQHLGSSKLDAAIGLTALTMLYLYRFICNTCAKRWPQHKKTFFFISTLRTAFVILLYTMISWLVNMNKPHNDTASKAAFKILAKVPRGFQDAGAPSVNLTIIKQFADQLPASVIVLLIEHISIAKSFGRINNYVIDPSQEMLAIGVTNLLGPFLGAYPATGSFSRTAIKSKAGVRTPLAGIITGIVVLLAIYALPAVFYYIPNSALSAVIIHAVGDLIAPPNTVYQFWRISPLEVIIFFAGVIVTVFSSIENGIYVTVAVSAALFLWRAMWARGRFMGRVTVHSVVGDEVLGAQRFEGKGNTTTTVSPNNGNLTTRNVFLPIDHQDGSNPSLNVQSPYPGIFIYRFSEGFNYPNAGNYLDYLVQYIQANTRRTNPHSYPKKGDRPWNDPGPRRGHELDDLDESKPTLKAVILDFSSVNNVDLTSTQYMIDIRNQLDRHAQPHAVEWHITNINNRWTKRALAYAGFGFPAPDNDEGEFQRWKPIFSVAEMNMHEYESAAANAERRDNKKDHQRDLESSAKEVNPDTNSEDSIDRQVSKSNIYQGNSSENRHLKMVGGLNRPFFHVDVTSALQSAIANVEGKLAAGKLTK